MFDFLKRNKTSQELDVILKKLQMNMANNYKDAAQLNLKEFEKLLEEFKEAGKLNEKQKAYYEGELAAFREKMKNFTHKDQKPYWV